MASVTEFNLSTCVVISGIIMAIYVLAGGMLSVVFTSVLFMVTIGVAIPLSF